ncbi:hypothetical protein [Alteribacillus sp. HJP-4]|uniref:hypothetical protein n=1 Tax=Alteribacillus sp. HJP-4 TaxID=2775394 RepID=UPI0035CD2A7D
MHTFLFQESTWLVKGLYYDNNENKIKAEGQINIIHDPQTWYIEQKYNLYHPEKEVIHTTNFSVSPIEGLDESAALSTYHPEQGSINGTIFIMENTMMLKYKAENSDFNSVEMLTQLSTEVYECKGFCIEDNIKKSSWSLRLTMSR